MERTVTGEIRKISFGIDTINSAMVFEVGTTRKIPQKGEIKIIEIQHDLNMYHLFGKARYNIWCKKADGTEFIWNYFEDTPCRVECFVP